MKLNSAFTGRARRMALAALPAILFAAADQAQAGTWTALANNAPGGVQLMMLLTDGTVMCHNGGGSAWYKLTPNSAGSYVNGTWSNLDSMSYTRRYTASQVLQNGKVMVAGGEYGTGGATTELYDPLANLWTEVTVPAGLICICPQGDGSNGAFRDPSSMLLPDGTMMVAPVFPASNNRTVIYDPVANTWSTGPAYLRSQNEATWVKLPDDSILTVDKSSTQSERFIPSLNRWINDANVPVTLYGSGAELGGALLLPDGRAFFIGGNGNTAFYTPSGTTNLGSWAAGPDLPNGQACPDAPAAMLVDGKVLIATSAIGNSTNVFPTPTSFYEYDPVANTYSRQNSPTGGLTENMPCYKASMLALPDGKVLYSDWSDQLYVYTPSGSALAAGKPTISGVDWKADGSLRLRGTKLNGISAGASYGDDLQMDSNYPIVRFQSGGNVYYGRTYDWSSTSVATGNQQLTTEFTLPSTVFQGPGSYSMEVVANGIASNPVTFYGPVWVDFAFGGFPFELGIFSFPYNTLAEGVNAATAGGTVAIKAGHRNEAITITKAMTIIPYGGSVTIGQ